jgi:hypothetical protein
MLRIKVFQNGSARFYNTKTFERKGGKDNEMYEFMLAMGNVDLGNRKFIHFVDDVADENIFISPVGCVIEVEEVAEE